MKLKEFTDYLFESGYIVNSCPVGNDYIVFSRKLYLGAFKPDRGNIVFWFNDNCILPARDFMLDGLDTTELYIRYPYKRIVIIKGFKHV